MIKRICLLALLLFTCASVGCGYSQEKETIPYVKAENSQIDKPTSEAGENEISIDVMFINDTNIDIGMLCIIDPKENKSVQISPIESQKSISINLKWPNEEENLRWALYNKGGDLCIEGDSKITGVKESVTIVFNGEDNVTKIDVQID